MNVFHKVALEGLKKNRTRTLVTVAGVLLSAAMFTAVVTFGVSLLDYLARGAATKYGGWHVAFPDADPAFVTEQVGDDEVACVAAYENIGYAKLQNGKNPEKPYLFLAGYTEEAFAALPVTLFSGRLPENGGEVLVSGKLATEAGLRLKLGDTLTVTVGSRMRDGKALWQSDPYNAQAETFTPQCEQSYQVVGFCQRPVVEEDAAPGYTLIIRADEAPRTASQTLLVMLKDPHRARTYAARAANGSAYLLNDHVLRFIGLSENGLFNGLLYAFGGVVLAIIMTGSVFLIYNAFTISLCERMRQLGVLMSVGATGKQLRNAVLFEGLCIGAAGIPLGMAAGLGCIRLVLGVVETRFANILYTDVPLTVVLSLPALLAAGAISLATILLSAYLPARKAVRTPVIECIRQTNEIKAESGPVKTSHFTDRLFGLNGTLALKNFKRNRKRYRSIVLSLVLSVTLFVAASAFVGDMKAMSGQETEFTTYDIGIAAKDMGDSAMLSLYDALKTVDGVTESSYQALQAYTCQVKASELSPRFFPLTDGGVPGETATLSLDLQFIADEKYQAFLAALGLPLYETAEANGRLIAVAKLTEESDALREPSDFDDLFRSNAARLSIVPKDSDEEQAREIDVTFVNIVPPDSLPVLEQYKPKPYMLTVLAPYSLRERFALPKESLVMKGMTFRSENPARSAAEMQERLEALGAAGDCTVYNMSGLMAENHNYIFIADVFAGTFIVMITLIAIANVFNTISTNIKLRRRELAMLRSVGMSEKDFQGMMNYECAFYGVRALLVGLPVAAIASWGMHRVMMTDDVPFAMPWASMALSAAGVLAIVFITMLYATRKIRRENIIDALRDDMT